MKIKSSLIRGIILANLLILSGLTSIVNGQNQDYRKVSLSVRGGATFENSGNGFRFFDSRFNVPTEISGIFGMGIQYALTPAWSLEGGYSYTQIRGRSESFTTNMNALSLKNIFSLNQILFTNRISNSINPFLTAGIGYDIYDYESPNETANNSSISYNLGVGVAFKVSQTIDLFTQYEYHIASNEVDNIIGSNKGLGADVLVQLTGGLRVNFGKKGTTHPSWRPVPVEVSPLDYEYLLSQDKNAQQLEQQIGKLEKQLEEQEQKHAKQINSYTDVIDSLKQKAAHLEGQLRKTQDSLAAVSQKSKMTGIGTTKSIPAGHYVQVFASLGLQSAQKIRSQSASRFGSSLENAEEQIFIAKRKQFYEVMIGVFNDYQKAERVQNTAIKYHNDAFVITFPRPISLQDLYKGIEKLN